MRTNPIEHKFGKPKPYPVSFGIYKTTRITPFGKCTYGNYKNYNIEIYDDVQDKMKLYYVSDDKYRWLKSKLVYFKDGIHKIIRSKANGL